MATPLFSIGGIASGLDTNSIVSQLMQIERIPLQQTQQRKATFQQRNDAWSQISTRLSALRDKARAIDTASDWSKFSKATSSDAAVGVTVTGSPAQGSLSFQVARLATSHQVASGNDSPTGASDLSASTDLVGAGTFSITVGGTQHDITTDSSTTLADLTSQINALGVGVSASIITVDSGRVKLSLQSSATGDDSQFSVSNGLSTMGTFGTVQQGLDAQVTLGSGPGAITVERPTNVIDDLISGVTLTLTNTTSAPVTVTINSDLEGAVGKVRDFVNELNSALSTINTRTRTASEGGTAGPLSTDSTARGLKLSLRSAISGTVAGLVGDFRTAASVGISLNRDGSITLDETKLRAAMESNFEDVQSLFARRSSSTDSRVTVTRTASSELDGTHTVAITQAATRASITGSAYSPPGSDQTFGITMNGVTANVTVPAASTLDAAVDAINAGLKSAGISGMAAAGDGSVITLTSVGYGSGNSFAVADDPWGLAGTHTGVDVAGTLGGLAATGNGRSLSGTGALDGLLVSISATPGQVSAAGGTLSLGTVTVKSGLASNFEELLDGIIKTGGVIDRATDRWDSQIKLADSRIERLEERLTRREAALRRQFTALETAMGRLQGLSSQLAAGLNSLNANR